ncbi:MAG: redoxin domain-containing protein [Acidobacteriota bacterium]
MSVEVGARAPEFTLMNEDRQPVSLSGLLANGPVVLAFVPAAFSGTCEKELCTFRDSLAEFAGLGAQVAAISVDSFFALKAWAAAQRFGFPLLSDFNKEVIHLYGVYNPDMIGLKGLAKRAVFVVDRTGIVRHREVLEDARLEPDYGAVRAAVASLG